MRIGSLKHKITFLSKDNTQDSFGGVSDDFVVLGQSYAQIIPLKGDEKYMSSHLNTEVNHKIRLRYRSDLDATMKILYGSRKFHIDSVINVHELNKETLIMAIEVFDG